ncbi:Caspase-8 [Bagarius yarrelli]|uniref:Caspase-8 n=1 Tax=Bagarius yarrelli TaxID=175774 RepID=A0A556TTB8_BAGYA|nr:Caspase-8 [Bagarius yarrelli]
MDLEKLHKVDEQLQKSEVAALKFLCMDHLGRKRLENVKDAKHLFTQLIEQDLLSNELFLPDLLYTIGRYDLLSKLGTNKTCVSRSLENTHSGVSLYRKMLYGLSEDVTDENLHNIKFLLNNLPKAKLATATFLDVLSEMEKMEMLGEDNLDELQNILSKSSKELAYRVQKFKNTSQQESMLSVSEEEENFSLPVQPQDEFMNVDNLERVFNKMHFQVEERKDLTSSGIMNAVEEFSLRDHSKMDAFVCCLLSHGEKGTVFGIDGAPVLICDLIQPFAHCSSLIGKPKLFFIQACQGKAFQKGVWRQDGTIDDECEEDAVQASGLSSIPVGADFLIGMATVESYKAFRHTVNGSIFIQELCKHLYKGCREKEDILSILTRVNRSVSVQDLNKYKQMPEPRYTLTKKLVLPLD